uniref:Uncharacterized protein n=1 Tax=Varanus komodoensis TaxID=61221 RepID=A0A8D2JDR9_VARKO
VPAAKPASLSAEESPSTTSTTPDSTDGGNDESDFPELQTAREFSEDEEEEASVEWGTPRELTFSYITIAAPPGSSPTPGEHGARGRRDSQARRARAPLPRTETCETFVPALGDSLENIPSLCPSPEGEGAPPVGHCQGLDPFSGWEGHTDCTHGRDIAEARASPPRSPVEQALEGGRRSGSSSSGSTSCSGTEGRGALRLDRCPPRGAEMATEAGRALTRKRGFALVSLGTSLAPRRETTEGEILPETEVDETLAVRTMGSQSCLWKASAGQNARGCGSFSGTGSHAWSVCRRLECFCPRNFPNEAV